MKNKLKATAIFTLGTIVICSLAIAQERGIIVLKDGERMVIDQLRIKTKPFKNDWERNCEMVDCKNTIKNEPKPKFVPWCPPTYCDPIDPNDIMLLIGDKTPHMRVRPNGQASLFIGNSQMTEPRLIELPKLEETPKDLRRLPVLPLVSGNGTSTQVLHWLKISNASSKGKVQQ